MKISDRVCAATPDELFNLVVTVSSSSDHIAGMWSEKVRDGWIFTLKPWPQAVPPDKRVEEESEEPIHGEGTLEIRRISLEPVRSKLISVTYTERAELFVEELAELMDRHPAWVVMDAQSLGGGDEVGDLKMS